MQFSRIVKPQAHKHQVQYIDGEPICTLCHARPVAGYVVGSSQFLTRYCLKCYRSLGIESKASARNPKFYSREGKS